MLRWLFTASFFLSSGTRSTSMSGIGLQTRPFQQQCMYVSNVCTYVSIFFGQVWQDTGSDPSFPEPGIMFWLVESLACFDPWTLRNWAVFFFYSGSCMSLRASSCSLNFHHPHFLTVTGLETPPASFNCMQRWFPLTGIAVFVCDWDNIFYLIYSHCHCFHSFTFQSLWGRLENFGLFRTAKWNLSATQ